MLKVVTAVALLLLAGVQARAASSFDQMFLRAEAQGSAYELAIASLAQTRATQSDVRTYAATLVNDHEAYNAALRDLAQSKGMALPSGMTTKDKQRLDRLAGTRGRRFDTTFIREARRVNSENIRNFRKEASQTADPEIRSFVSRFLEVDEKHDAGARALSGRTVASRMPTAQPPPMDDTMPIVPPAASSAMPVILPSPHIAR